MTKGTVFDFLFKDELTADDIELAKFIAAQPLVLHPDVFFRLREILDAHREPTSDTKTAAA